MNAGSRIEQRRTELGMSQSELARKLARHGVSIHQTAIDKMEKRDSKHPRAIKEIALVLGVTEEWLLKGREPKEPPPLKMITAPIVSGVSAGALANSDFQDEIIGTAQIGELDPKGDWIVLKVEGDSMDRISPPGSLIFVNRKDKRLVPNGCYVVSDGDDGVTYKRYRPSPPRLEPVSTNPKHEPMFFDHEPTVIGRVRRTQLEM